jgi:MFS transporter, CP family, cyanate transporter
VGIGPLLPRIGPDLGMSHAASGMLGTIPVLCMGLFALPAARLAARWGTRRAIFACLAMIALGGLLRSVAPTGALLLAGTIPVGVGMGLCGALLPVAVKERFARRAALATGVYTTGIQIGAVASSLAVVALAAAGSWRLALAVISIATAAVAASWVALDDDAGAVRPRAPAAAELRAVARNAAVWTLTGSFALMSVIYYGLIAWLPEAYAERGWSESSAAALVAVLTFAQLPGGMAFAWLAARAAGLRVLFSGCAALVAIAGAGLAMVPSGAWVWAAFAGLGIGILFPVVLTLPLDLSSHPTAAGAIAAVMLTGGYTVAAIAPVMLGALRDATGSFHTALFGLAAVAVTLFATSFLIPRGGQAWTGRPDMD